MAKTIFLLILISASVAMCFPQNAVSQESKVPRDIWQKANATGTVRVIVDLNTPTKPESKLNPEALQAHRQAIAAAQDNLLLELAGTKYELTAKLITVPTLGLKLGPDGLAILERSNFVKKVTEDKSHPAIIGFREKK